MLNHKEDKGAAESYSLAKADGVPYGIRTRVAAVKGRCPRPLDEGDSENLFTMCSL